MLIDVLEDDQSGNQLVDNMTEHIPDYVLDCGDQNAGYL